MKKIALLLMAFFSCSLVYGQSYARYQDCQLQTSLGQAVAGASVYFLTQPANTSNLTPQAQVYSSSTGGTVTQPLKTDGHGQCAAYLDPGTYTVVYQSQFTGTLIYPDQTVSFGAIGTINPISQVQWPIASGTSLPSICPVAVSGNLISGSNVITALSSTNNVYIGQLVTGTGIPASTYISTVNAATSSITISNSATTTQNTVSLSFYSIGQPFQNTATNTEQFCTNSGWSNGFPSGVVPVGNGGTGTSTAPTSGQLLLGNAGGTAYAPQTMGGDCSITNLGVESCVPLVHIAGTETITGAKTFNTLPTLPPGTPIGNQAVSVNALASNLPAVNAKQVNGKFNPKAYGASGSNLSTTGTISSSSSSLVISSAIDFSNSQGILVLHAGPLNGSLLPPTSQSVTPIGTSGSTTYQYCVSSIDSNGGESACGSTFQTTTGNAILGGAVNSEISNYNQIAVTPIGLPALAYAVYSKPSNSLMGIMVIPSECVPWLASNSYPVGTCVIPATPTGRFYRATTGGTSGGSNPAFCTSSAGCTTSDGSVVWQMQAFTWEDDGKTNWIASNPGNSIPITVALAAPASALADSLVSSISSGGGTTSLTLSSQASTSVSGVVVVHDDTSSFNAMISDIATLLNQVGYGINAYTAPKVEVPSGIYNISSALSFPGAIEVAGDNAIVIQNNPMSNVFNLGYISRISGMQFSGGKDTLYITNSNLDASRTFIDHNWFYPSFGYPIKLIATGYTDYHLSMHADISDNTFFNTGTILFTASDLTYFHHNWSEWANAFSVNQLYSRAAIMQYIGAGSLQLNANMFVPTGINDGTRPPSIRYIDNLTNSITATENRFGAENGGWPIVFNYCDWTLSTSQNSCQLIFRDNPILSAGATSTGGVVRLVKGVPNQIVFEGNQNTYFAPPIYVDPTFNLDLDIAAISTIDSGTPQITISISPDVPQFGYSFFPVPSLLSFYYPESLRYSSAVPSKGVWELGQLVRFQNYSGLSSTNNSAFIGWVVVKKGMAAPVVGRTTAYTVGQFVEDPTNNGVSYECTTAGTTAGSAPSYNTTGTTTDGSAVFTAYGQTAQFVRIGGPQVQIGSGSACTITAGAIGNSCTTTISLVPAQPDTKYVVSGCSAVGTSQNVSLGNIGTLGTSSFVAVLSATTTSGSSGGTINCSVYRNAASNIP